MSKGKLTAAGNSMLEAKRTLGWYVQTKIKSVAGGQSETLNGRGGKRKTTAKVAASCEALTPLTRPS